jgi:hypothetical protein
MKRNWLSISIFCDIRHWNTLYQSVIVPLLRSKKVSNWKARAKLFDERHRLDLYLEVEQQSQEQLVALIHKMIMHQLASFPADGINQEPPYSNEVLFMPFPNNSVQYGLFRIVKKKTTGSWLDTVLENSIKQLIKNESTYEEVITLLFNLYGFIINQMADGNADFTAQLIERIEQIDHVKNKEHFRILYDAEKDLFNELWKDIKAGCDVNGDFFLRKQLGIRDGKKIPDWAKGKAGAIRTALAISYLDTISAHLLISNFIKWSVLTALSESMLELIEA